VPIFNIDKNKPTITNPVTCEKCSYRWQAVYPAAAKAVECPECHTMNKFAVDITEECADVFYDHFHDMPERVKKSISLEQLNNIYHYMVIPVIDKAKSLD